jgi:putative ABC transport system substrate-binding protein
MYDPGGPATEGSFRRIREAAKEIRVAVHPLPVRARGEFDSAIAAAQKERVDAILVIRGPVIVAERRRLAELAARARLAAMYDDREFVEAGGLMSYGANLADSYRRASLYVDRILKGARPGDLPIEQPTTFELIINLKAARLAGITIPQSVLLRADQVIE